MKQTAPIILFVYNRPWHTGQTLEALMKNKLADQSTLYIFSDGYKENASEEDINKIETVRKLIRSKKWCREVNIIEVEKNKGLANAVIEGVERVISEFGKVIVLEDDIVTSDQFLIFLNGALQEYEYNEHIFGVTGFVYPGDKPITNTHFLPIACSWGWATWKTRWDKVIFDASLLERKIIETGSTKKIDFGGYPFFKMLQDQGAGKVNSWAIRFYASMFLNRACFVYPVKSLVKNIGFDEQGSHTKGPDKFFDEVVNETIQIGFPAPVFDQNTRSIQRRFEQQFKNKPSQKADNFLVKRIFRKIKKIISA